MNRYHSKSADLRRRARRQIDRELALIEKLELAGYFLIVWDIVEFCRRQNILVQGRGSAANSAVCYSLGITAVDPVEMELLFERFLSEERGEWPDIDLDLPSGDQRERAIQYVYATLRPARRRHDRQHHHLSRPLGRTRHRQSAGLPGTGSGAHLGAGSFLGLDRSERNRRAPIQRSRLFAGKTSADWKIPGSLHDHPGSAAPSGPAFRRHGDLRRPARFRRSAGTRHHARPRRHPVGQGRLRRHGNRQSGSAGPRHDGRARRLHPAHSHRVSRRSGPGASAARRQAGLSSAAKRRHHRNVSGGKPRADVLPAAPAARAFLRHRGAGGHHPARPHRWPDAESISAPPAGPRDGRVPASVARARASPDIGRSVVSRAVAPHGDDRGRIFRRRSRRAAPRHGIQALRSPHARHRDPAARGHDAQRHHRQAAGRHRSIHHRVRAVRFSRIARRQFRLDRLCQRVSEMPLPGRFHRRDPEQSAHGFLRAGHIGQGCAAPRPALQSDRCHALGLAVHHRGRKRRAARSPGNELRQRTARTAGPSDSRRARASAVREHPGFGGPRPRASQRRTAQAERNRRAQFHHRIAHASPRRALGLRTRHPSRLARCSPTPNPQSPIRPSRP